MSSQLLDDVAMDDGQRKHHVAIIGRAKERMERLIQDLLDVARLEAGKTLAVELRRVRPASHIRETYESFALAAREKGLRLDLHVPDELPEVPMDIGRIQQVLANLIGNALKFTPEGGGIEVRATTDRGALLVSVHDSGPGISAEDLDQIFVPFWQAPHAKRHGAGLGLPIVRGIVEQHGGRVWATSRPGGGTTFSFTLPMAEEQKPRAA